MAKIRIDAQGRIVLPRDVRRRLGIAGHGADLELRETTDGLLLELPPAAARVATADDGLPAITIEGLPEPVSNDSVLAAIERERSVR
ncbi:MAG: AbrB/MazE/SpoVT family DNA-binding domain-containing protein [Actinomycetota bacterium]|jgi:AbrB family looped-hinge helix DNA binding protein|nr:AbrB/MazE/SpoVT family DNA-binding domain-containing protein [Actinomycetota bacterium]